MTPSEIRKLISLAEHGKTRDIAIYAKACGKLEDTLAKISALNADKRQHSLASGSNFNTIALWQRWAEGEANKLESQHLDASREKEAARQIAVKSLAKVQALEILLKKALKEDVLIKRRRAEQNGQPPDA